MNIHFPKHDHGIKLSSQFKGDVKYDVYPIFETNRVWAYDEKYNMARLIADLTFNIFPELELVG